MTAPSEIHNVSAARFNLSPKCMQERTRHRHIAQPRQLAMLIMREAGYSLPAIGRFYAVHHTTVLHAVEAAQERVQSDMAWKGHRACILVVLGPLAPTDKPKFTRSSPMNRKPHKPDSRVAWIPEGREMEYRDFRFKKNLRAHEAKSLMLTGALPPSSPQSAA